MKNITFEEMLDQTPLYQAVNVSGFLDASIVQIQQKKRSISTVEIDEKQSHITRNLRPKLYCDYEDCQSYTFFKPTNESQVLINLNQSNQVKIYLKCCNCNNFDYTFYLRIDSLTDKNADNKTIFEVEKIGQLPRHGRRMPKKASNIIGKERELFFKGNISENQGLGIGAFSYYRRVLDLQKNKIFDEIIKVLKLKLGNELLIEELTQAKSETQFTSAIDKIKTALPESLLIKGHNPLRLIYSALSEGLHSHTDIECRARSRTFSTHFSITD